MGAAYPASNSLHLICWLVQKSGLVARKSQMEISRAGLDLSMGVGGSQQDQSLESLELSLDPPLGLTALVSVSLQELNRGAREVEVTVNGDVVFRGDLDKGCGNQVFDYGKTIPCEVRQGGRHQQAQQQQQRSSHAHEQKTDLSNAREEDTTANEKRNRHKRAEKPGCESQVPKETHRTKQTKAQLSRKQRSGGGATRGSHDLSSPDHVAGMMDKVSLHSDWDTTPVPSPSNQQDAEDMDQSEIRPETRLINRSPNPSLPVIGSEPSNENSGASKPFRSKDKDRAKLDVNLPSKKDSKDFQKSPTKSEAPSLPGTRKVNWDSDLISAGSYRMFSLALHGRIVHRASLSEPLLSLLWRRGRSPLRNSRL